MGVYGTTCLACKGPAIFYSFNGIDCQRCKGRVQLLWALLARARATPGDRPPMNETEVRAAIDTFLQDVLGAIPCYDLEEQGGNGSACWAFWVLQDDTTSYVHPPDAVWPDYRIEWYGTMWEPTNA